MDHRRKGGVNLNGHVTALKSNRIADLVAVNMNANQGTVDQLDFNFFVARLKRNLFLGFALGSLLDFFDDKFHFSGIEGAIWLGPTVSNSVSDAFDEFTGDANDDTFGLQAGLVLSFAQGILTITNHTGNISDRSRVHIA